MERVGLQSADWQHLRLTMSPVNPVFVWPPPRSVHLLFSFFAWVLLLYSVRSNQVRIRKHSLIIAVISGLKNANNPEVSVSKL